MRQTGRKVCIDTCAKERQRMKAEKFSQVKLAKHIFKVFLKKPLDSAIKMLFTERTKML